ncbi:MAG: hypothetical protein LBO06_06590 [Bacteroidales bacterium]|jgi:uncharacterized membrane protein YjjP (DUF1212 family)|nr:hypothetical protein [Bacteroidales bacterium]
MEFKISRFWSLAKRDFAINWKKYISFFVAVFGIGFFSKTLKLGGNDMAMIVVCLFMLLSAAMNAFLAYKKERTRVTTILVPSSVEEKWLLEFVKFYIVFPVILMALMLLGLLVGEGIIYQTREVFDSNWDWIVRNHQGSNLYMYVYIYAGVACAFFASLFFKKGGLFKMIIALIVIFIVYSVLQYWLLKNQLEGLVDVQTGKIISKGSMMEYGFAFEHYVMPLYTWLSGIIAVVMTAMSYIRLKYEERA